MIEERGGYKIEALKDAIRELVGALHQKTMGAYGVDYYEGQYEEEIDGLARVILSIMERGRGE
jgi:hypothetical protein